MSFHQPAAGPARITLVESEACHFCEEAHRALADLAETHPLVVDTLDVRSEAGRLLMQTHRAPMTPLVLLDGDFFSHGRLPRRKLATTLDKRRVTPASSAQVD